MASNVTPLRDAEWTLKCAEAEKQAAKDAVDAANVVFLKAARRHRAALARVYELKREKPR